MNRLLHLNLLSGTQGDRSRTTNNHRGAQWIVVTQGSRPVWVTSAKETYRLYPPPADHVVNAMAATIAWATRDGRPVLDAVRLAIAGGGENLRQLLPCRLDRAQVENRANNIQYECHRSLPHTTRAGCLPLSTFDV